MTALPVLRVPIKVGWVQHPLLPPSPPVALVEERPLHMPIMRNCRTPYPEPICSCGLYLIEWERG